MISDITKDIRW